jgi:hypothetical protein
MKTNKVLAKTKPLFKEKSRWQPRKALGEIWIMFRDTKDQRKIISAWRYPGISKPGEAIPIPEDIKQELMAELN